MNEFYNLKNSIEMKMKIEIFVGRKIEIFRFTTVGHTDGSLTWECDLVHKPVSGPRS